MKGSQRIAPDDESPTRSRHVDTGRALALLQPHAALGVATDMFFAL